ncbi:TIGR04255 family protein [Marinobacteraceae bacterium S3BR75-40.1]
MGQIPNSPLIEAIFEIRWGEEEQGHFKYSKEEVDFFPGIFFNTVKDKGFGHSENVGEDPDRPKLPFEVRHRFRKNSGSWPCFQIGLGLFTANQIGNRSVDSGNKDEYDWKNFKPVIIDGIQALNSSLSDGIKNLTNPRVYLRFQDGFILENNETIESFVSKKLKTEIKIPDDFLTNEFIENNSENININFSHNCTKPEGKISITVSTAFISGKKGLVFETVVASSIKENERTVEHLNEWCEHAHDLQMHAFRTIIETDKL